MTDRKDYQFLNILIKLNMKKIIIIFAVLIGLSACYTEQNKNNISECRSFTSMDFQFMTKDAICCYVYFNSASNFIQVKNAIRNIVINHDALELKDPKICYYLQEELYKSYNLDVIINEVIIPDKYYKEYIK